MGIGSLEMAREDILDHALDNPGREGGAVDLAEADDPVGGGEADDDEIAPTLPRRRVRDDEDLAVGESHPPPSMTITCLSPTPRRTFSRAVLISSKE